MALTDACEPSTDVGAEIDKRVDARLAATGAAPAKRGDGGQLSPAATRAWPGIVLALGSMGIGTAATAAVLDAANSIGPTSITTSVGTGQVFLVIMIWVIVGVINVAYSRRR